MCIKHIIEKFITSIKPVLVKLLANIEISNWLAKTFLCVAIYYYIFITRSNGDNAINNLSKITLFIFKSKYEVSTVQYF